ncbi:MAG: T9SS type A sorting domain-containing protein [Paludibacter sp.]|nr:T9SS type A sorting domain-containing protein [Paludibacter sp.]
MKKSILTITFLVLSITIFFAQIEAFPGAEGFGKYTKGARAASAPTIYHVTNLNDSGTGSLRDAVSQSNRIVVFDVAGVIKIDSRLIFSGNITVAGQTAPGEGIVVYGNGVSFSGAKDVIVRYMRFRMGLSGDSGKDAAGIANGTDMIFDHCSITWGLDETFSVSWDDKGTEPGNITIQNSIIGQGIMTHSAGGLIQTDGGVTLYKNLYIDNKTRNPKVKGLNQYVNNVVYDWGSGGGYILGDSEGSSWAVIENNYFIKGPETGTTDAFVRANENFQICQSGNYLDYTTDGTLNGTLAVEDDFGPGTFVADYNSFTGIPKSHPVIENKLTAEAAYNWVVDSVGAVLPYRDEVDKYLINELTSLGTAGALIYGESSLGLPNTVGYVFAGIKAPDSDNDGIPDTWEDANGLDKNDASDALTVHESGYLNIERYINSITSGQNYVKYPTLLSVKAVDTDFVTIKWTNNEAAATNIIVEKSIDDVSFEEVATIDPALSEYKITGLASNTTYYFRLKTIKGNQESVYTSSVKGATLGEAAPPVACVEPVPEDQSTVASYTQVTLQWTNLTGVWGGNLYYNVFVGTDAGNLSEVATGITATSYNLTVLSNTTYFWRVDTSNLLGSQEGDVWSFLTGQKPERGKVAYFPMNETEGTTAMNEVQGYATAENFTPTWGTGVVNNCVTIPSSPTNAAFVQNHYDAISLGNESFSVELWFKSAGGAVDWYLLHKGSHTANTTTGATGKWFGVQYNNTGSNDRLTWAIDDNITKTALDITGSTYFDNVWHHLVGVRDVENDVLNLYIDGVLKGTKTDVTGDISQTENLVIGNTNVNFVNAFGGSLDEISIYKGALTAEDVLDNYNEGMKTGLFNPRFSAEMSVYPLPFVDEFNIVASDFGNRNLQVKIATLSGTVLYTKNFAASGNRLHITGLEFLNRGAYIVTVSENNNNLCSKLLLK